MANDGETRRLAAVMASDVVGYSALMGRDEVGTLSAIRSLRKELWGPKIDDYGGRVVKTTGDGQLTEFSSVADAVQCAVEIQRAMQRRNADIPGDHRIVLRIGINQGDVIIDGDDIYGDGVNVAARLEEIAEPGGICVSRPVRDEIRDKLLYDLEDLGEQDLKNISRPVRVFRVSIDETGDGVGAWTAASKAVPTASSSSAAAPATSNRMWLGIAGIVVFAIAAIYVLSTWQPWVARVEAANVANMAFALPDKPSIAVLPFDNFSGDPDQEFLADGFSEDILTALSKLPALFVISRTTTFTYKGRDVTVKQVAEDLGVRYVLEGSVQRSGDNLRVTAQLIDAIDGQHVWADRYDRDVNDLFAVKDEITLNVVSNIGAELDAGESDRISRRETKSLEAWLLYRQAREEWLKLTRESSALAKDFAERAVTLDQRFASAKALLGAVYAWEAQVRYTSTPAKSVEKARALYDEALEIDPLHTFTLFHKARLHLLAGEIDKAIALGERAVRLDPNDWFARAGYGRMLHFGGRPADAIPEIKLAMRLSPRTPPSVSLFLADAYLLSGDPDSAIPVYREVLRRASISSLNELWARSDLAVALAFTGQDEEGREQVAKAIEVSPKICEDIILDRVRFAVQRSERC